MSKIIFITGTDTGVGKTVLTAMLLRHLREEGVDALAMKPFCSGSRGDARLLRSLQENLLTLDEVNPFFFKKPVAPAAAGGLKNKLSLDAIARKIRAMADRCDVLLVEGIGGLLVPLSEKLTVADVISALKCPVIVVSANKLGTINHTLMTCKILQDIDVKRLRVVMVDQAKPDVSAAKNPEIIAKMASTGPVFLVPNLKIFKGNTREIKINVKFLKKTLARILEDDSFMPVLPLRRKKRLINKTR